MYEILTANSSLCSMAQCVPNVFSLQIVRLQDPPSRVPDPAAGSGQLQGATSDALVQQR